MTTDIRLAPETRIVIQPIAGSTWSDLWRAFIAFAGWDRDERAPRSLYHYVEALSACTFEPRALTDLSAWTPPDDALEGRVFGGQAELRWQRAGATAGLTLAAWATRELGDGEHDERAERVTRVDRPYYLIGRAGRDGLFHEAQYPHVTFRYPVPPDATLSPPNGRAFVTVAEYHRATPTWTDLSQDEIDTLLAQPLLVGHRFLNVDVGV